MTETPTPTGTPHEIADLKHVRGIARSVIEQDLQIPQSLWPEQIALAVHQAGFRRQRVITTVEEILELNALDIVLYNDSANAGPIETYIVPDDGTVAFSTPSTFHLMDGAGNYIYAWAMPLPLTLIWEVQP